MQQEVKVTGYSKRCRIMVQHKEQDLGCYNLQEVQDTGCIMRYRILVQQEVQDIARGLARG